VTVADGSRVDSGGNDTDGFRRLLIVLVVDVVAGISVMIVDSRKRQACS